MRVVLLAGGTSAEREVSFMSAAEIQKTLVNHEIILIEIPSGGGMEWVPRMVDAAPEVVMTAALHGGLGENGAVQGLLECLGIPYTGSKVLGSALCMDKAMSKSIMRAVNITVPDDVLIPSGEPLALYRDAIVRMGFPEDSKVIVKPNQGGSSVGVSIVSDWLALENAFHEAAAMGDSILIERFIPGREITCGLVERDGELISLPILDIAADDADAFFDYNAKYFSNGTRINASALPAFIQDMALRIARQAFVKLHCGSYARVDMIVRGEQVYVLEVNTLPGMTSHSLVPKAAALYGWSFEQLLEELLRNA